MSNIKTGDILNFDYTGAVQSTTLPKGTYKLECWGAAGGDYDSVGSTSYKGYGAWGGYSKGTLSLITDTKLFIYVGGKGTGSNITTATGGFNGGGAGLGRNDGWGASGGGGASDIRIGTNNLYARVIVAGGGGGGGHGNYHTYRAIGQGGGLSGGYGHTNSSTSNTLGTAIQTGGTAPGTQTTGYSFGQGGNASTSIAGGGGGGWYGGYAGGGSAEGGGGSGYVYTSSTASNYPSGCLLTSSYYLSNAETIAGNQSFTSPTGSSETGHSGNGYCRITVIECKSTALYTRINNSMKKATAFYFKLNNNKMYGVGSANFNGTVMNFDYTGSVQTVTLAPGRYKLECWGAQGGDGTNYSSTGLPYTGGKGGYSSGILNIIDSGTLYIVCGSAGSTVANTSNTYNGGGGSGNTNYQAGSGGGATHIGLKEGLLTTFSSDYTSKLLLVAGGGGGGGNCSIGGAGGGISGVQPKTSTQYESRTSGIAGTQTSGYLFGQGQGGNGQNYAGGGGGGFYGGGQGDNSTGGGGGSGYINTSLLTNCTTTAGDTSFPSPSGSTETGHSGNGYVRITKLTDIIYLTHANNDIMDFNYTGSTQSKTLKPGTYTIECWGGQGGSYNSYIGGYGGYSKGTITLTKATTVYISVGGAGSSSSTAAGFNGGGTGISSGRGGGGATDVRIGQNSLYSRVIVAGGGGGAGVTSANANPCGCGGGEYGGDGYYNNTTGSYTTGQNRCGGSASQTAGGITWSTGTQATFGQGGNASGYSCGGGGGGWYGGGGAYDSDSDSDGRWGGGGSGYVYTSSTAKNYPNGCLLNSTYYLTNAQTIAGNTSFTSPTGSAETGHTGNGFCRITNLNPTQYGLYVKTNSGWKHIDL